jgi:hypothetical protein
MAQFTAYLATAVNGLILGLQPRELTRSKHQRSGDGTADDIPRKMTDACLTPAIFWRVIPEPSLLATRQGEPAPGEGFLNVDHVPQRGI